MQSASQFNELVKNRRSTFPKQFIPGKQISNDIIEQILINATWAPNHGQTEPWHFTVFSGKGLEKFATFQSEFYKKAAGENFKEENYLKLKNNPLLASHIIAIGMKRTTTKRIPEIEDVEAVACAVQNIYLSVTAYGLGGYWTSGGVTYKEEAKSFFELNEEDKLLGFFYVGHIATASSPAKRSPLEEKVTWVSE
ncbi:MAG: nitroreductase [Ferruginibacter sp.]